MVDLYRFMRKDYAESFLEGNIYMSALGYFWANGFESQQDINEGTVQMQAPAQSPFPQVWKSAITGSVRYRLEAYKYCNLLCMVMHHYNTQKSKQSVLIRECAITVSMRLELLILKSF